MAQTHEAPTMHRALLTCFANADLVLTASLEGAHRSLLLWPSTGRGSSRLPKGTQLLNAEPGFEPTGWPQNHEFLGDN